MSHHISIPSLSSTPSDDGTKSVVTALCSPPSGRFVGHITCSSTSRDAKVGDDKSSPPPCSSSRANLLRSSRLLPTPFADSESGATSSDGLEENVKSSTDLASKPIAIACLDLSDRRCTGRRSGAKGHRLDWILSSLGRNASVSSKSLLSAQHSAHGGIGCDDDADSALLAIGHADGSVSVRLLLGPPPELDDILNNGEEVDQNSSEYDSILLASTQDSSPLLGGSTACPIVALAFLPSRTKEKAKQDNDATVQIVALTKGGSLVFLELFPRDTQKDGNGSTQKSNPPKIDLAIRSIVGSTKFSDSTITGALSVGQTGNGVVYVAIGVEDGVLILRPSSPIYATSEDGKYVCDWNSVACVDLPSPTTSLAFSTAGSCVRGFGDAPVVLCAGQVDGEVALLDATASSGLDETDEDGGTPTFQPFYFVEPAELASNHSVNEDTFEPITSVVCHRDWTKQGAGRLLVAMASGRTLRVLDGSAFEVFYEYDFGGPITDLAFALDKMGAPRVVVAKADGETALVGMRTWGLLLEGSPFLKLHERFHPSSVPTPFIRRSSTGKLYNEESVMSIEWGPGDHLFEACGNKVLVYNSSTWNYDAPPHASSVSSNASIILGNGEKGTVRTIATSNDGKFLAAAIENVSGGFQLYIYKRPMSDADNGSWISPQHCQFASNITSLSYSPDSRYLCVATLYTCAVYTVDEDNGISDEPLKTFNDGKDAATWSSDGKYLAIGKLSNVLITIASEAFDDVCSIDVGLEDSHRISCLSFSVSTNQLLIGSSDSSISFAEEDGSGSAIWKIARNISHTNEVNSIYHSPDPSSPYFVVLGKGEICYIYSKTSLTIVQIIQGDGPLSAASFNPSGSMLALSGETAQNSAKMRGDLLLVRVGEVLNTSWYPLQSSGDDLSSSAILEKLNSLSELDRQQLLYHNGSGGDWPFCSRVQSVLEAQRTKRQTAKRGSVRKGQLPPREETTSILADILQHFPRAVFATRGCNGKSIFDITMEVDNPRALKLLFYSALVACRAHHHLMMNDDVRSGYITNLLTLSSNEYPDVCLDIVQQMVLWPVPTLELLETWKVKGGEPIYEVGSSPTSQQIFDGASQPFGALSRPMVLPLPGICSLPFLSAVVSKVPVEVFNHDILGLVLDELWFNGTHTMFLLDFMCFIILFASTSALFILHATATKEEAASVEDMTCGWQHMDNHTLGLCATVFSLNVLFGVRELR